MKRTFTFLLLAVCFFSNAQNPQLEEITKLYISGDFDLTIKKAKEYMVNDKNNIDVNLILGRALTDTGEFEEAIPFLKVSIEKDGSWRKAWALGYSGSCYFMLEEYENSKAAIKSCRRPV